MTKRVLFATIIAALVGIGSASAFAETTPPATSYPKPDATQTQPSAQQPAAAQAPADQAQPSPQGQTEQACQAVTITRPEVTQDKNKFMVVFFDGNLALMEACNSDLKVRELSHAAIGVDIVYSQNGAVVHLPYNYKSGAVSNSRCVVDPTTSQVIDGIVYRGNWSDGLPDHVELKPLDPNFYSKTALVAACKALMAKGGYN